MAERDMEVKTWPWVYPNTGAIAPTPASIGLGCGTDFSNNWGNYAWLETTDYAPRFTPYRSGQIRRHHAFQWDMSILKRTKINERMSAQFGFEALTATSARPPKRPPPVPRYTVTALLP